MYNICLRPNLSTSQPNRKLPATPPQQNIDTIQESSSVVNGPLFNGVSSDSNIRKLNDGQPHDVPKATMIKFASNNLIKIIYERTFCEIVSVTRYYHQKLIYRTAF